MKLFENLSQKLGVSCQEINEKLGIKENASKPEILNALGVYAIFDEKENLSSYIADKISNKTKELEASNLEKEKALNEINELKNQLSNFELTKSHLKELIKNEFNKIDFTTKTDFEQLDINKIDYSNVKKSILQQASELNWEVKEQPQSQEQPQENNFKAKGILTRY